MYLYYKKQGKSLYMEDIYVQPQQRRKGVGLSLLRSVSQVCLPQQSSSMKKWIKKLSSLGSTRGKLSSIEFFCFKLELAIHWVLQIFGGIEFDWKRRLALFSDESMRNGTTSKTRSIYRYLITECIIGRQSQSLLRSQLGIGSFKVNIFNKGII